VIGPPAGTKVYLAAGVADMRKGFDGLGALVQQHLKRDPFGGAVYAFRGKRGDLIKLLWWDGQGLVLHAKRLERGRFIWPATVEGVAVLTPARCRCCSKGSIGGARSGHRNRRWYGNNRQFYVLLSCVG
jgi:transposase